jgi:hypothetical protein
MNVASKELCEELRELSGWKKTDRYWHQRLDDGAETDKYNPFVAERPAVWKTTEWKMTPAYDLGYLLRKLPQHVPRRI